MADNIAPADLGIFAKTDSPTVATAPDLGIFTKDAPQAVTQPQEATKAITPDLGMFAKPTEVPAIPQTSNAPVNPTPAFVQPRDAERAANLTPKTFAHSFDPSAPNSIYNDTQLAQTARKYYTEKDGFDPGSDKAAIDKFMSDRTWASANSVSGLKELSYATGKKTAPKIIMGQDVAASNTPPISQEQLQRLGYLRNYWNDPTNLPTMFDKGGRDIIPTALTYAAEGAVDPMNLVGGVAGKFLGKGAGYVAGLGTSAATNAALDAEGQATDITTGNQDSYRPLQTAEAAGIGALTHVAGTALTAGIAPHKAPAPLPDAELQAFKLAKIGAPDEVPNGNFQGAVGTFVQKTFDKFNSWGTIQKELTGVGKSIKDLKEYTLTNQTKAALGNPEVEHITDAAVKINGKIYTAPTHSKALDLGLKEQNLAGADTSDLGPSANRNLFMTSSGRVVTPEQATALPFAEDLPSALGRNTVGAKPPANAPAVIRDPALLPYHAAQRITSTLTRAQHRFEVGGILPPDPNAPVGTASFKFDPNIPSLHSVVEPFLADNSVGNFFLYAAAKRVQQIKNVRNPALVANGMKPITTFFDDPDYWLKQGVQPNDIPAHVDAKLNQLTAWGDAQPNFQESLAKLKSYGDNDLDYSHQSGLISDASRHNILQAGGEAAHVPFYAAGMDAGTLDKAAGAASAPGSPARAKLLGSTGNVAPFLDSIMQRTTKTIKAGDTNAAKLSFYDMVDEAKAQGNPVADKLYDYVSPQERMTLMKVFYNSAKKSLGGAGADVEDDLDRLRQQVNPTTGKNYTVPEAMQHLLFSGGHTPPDFIDAFGMSQLPKDMENVDMFFRKGEIQFVKLKDKGLIDTANAMQGDTSTDQTWNFINGAMTRFSKFYSRMITADPRYVAKNMARDTLGAPIKSEFGFKPIWSSAQGVTKTFTDQEGYRKFLANGAGGSGMSKSELIGAAANEGAEKDRSAAGYLKGVRRNLQQNYVTGGWQNYQDFLEHFEMGPRFQEAKLAADQGMSPLTQARAAQEVSTNFARSGSGNLGRRYASWTPFFNAGMQGIFSVGQTFKDHPARATGLIGGLIVAPMVLSHIANSGNPAYEDIPDAVKYQNVFIPVPKNWTEYKNWFANGGQGPMPEIKSYIPFPAPYDYGGFGGAANILFDAAKNHSGIDVGKAVMHSFLSMMPGLSTPALVTPWVDLATNQNWTGSPITPGSVADLPPKDQVKENTSELAKWAVNKFEEATRPPNDPLYRQGNPNQRAGNGSVPLTPIEADFLGNYFMAGVLQYIPQMANAAMRAGEVATKGVPPTPRGDELDINHPLSILSKAWTMSMPNRNSKAMNDLYDLQKRVQGLVKSGKNAEKDFLSAVSPDSELNNDEFIDASKVATSIKSTTDMLSKLRDQYNLISDSTTITDPDEKRRQLDANIAQRNQIARIAMNQIASARNVPALTQDIFGNDKAKYADLVNTPAYTWLANLFNFNAKGNASDQTKNMFAK